MARPSLAGRVLGRDKWIAAGAITLVVLAAAGYILRGAGTGMSTVGMAAETGPAGALLSGLPDMLMPMVWTPGYAAVIFLMWWLMMIAMMVPSAAPTILLYGALYPERGLRGTFQFLCGYLIAWAGFSLLATALQAALASRGLVSAMYMNLATPWLSVFVLIGAGLYQFSGVKASCLNLCRGPVEALTRHRRTGPAAAFRMGLSHGGYCLGCCWALMALLFVGGVMNLWWILAITLYVAAEKLAPWGARLPCALGLGLVLAGLALAVSAVIAA